MDRRFTLIEGMIQFIDLHVELFSGNFGIFQLSDETDIVEIYRAKCN